MRFVADSDATVPGKPGDGAFDFRAMPAETFAGVDSTLGDAEGDAALAQQVPVRRRRYRTC